MKADEKNLDLLAVFHYVLAAVSSIFSCFLLLMFMWIGWGPMFHPPAMLGSKGGLPPEFMGRLFLFVEGAFVLFAVLYVVCLVMAGRFLRKRRHYIFCLITAAFECMRPPFGTVLGVLTIIMLLRPEIKALFDQPGFPPGSVPGGTA
jgi:hypothetical protein